MLKTIGLVIMSTIIGFSAANRIDITPKRATDIKTITYTYDHAIQTAGKFCVNSYIETVEEAKALKEATVRPANVFLKINSKGKFTNSQGEATKKDYDSIYSLYLKDLMIPNFVIEDLETEAAFAKYWNNEWKKWDISIVSSNPEVLLKARTDIPEARGILDYSKTVLEESSWGNIIKEVHTSRANTLLINKANVTYDFLYYFQARLKTVWVDDRDASDFEITSHIANGVDGVIVKNAAETIQSLTNSFNKNSVYDKFNYNRPVFNIAHRGLPATNYENSLEGCVEAYEKGATHIEIDIQLTKDKKLAIMHDDTIDRTTTGEGKIPQYTAEELKQFKIDSSLTVKLDGPGVAIPMLDDILNRFKGTKLVIVIEIKTNDSQAVDILKTYLEEAGMESQVVVISFYTAQLLAMRNKLPYVPTADLNTHDQASFGSTSLQLLNSYNMIPDSNTAAYSSSLLKIMNDRGYAVFQWTYTTLSSMYNAMKTGITGLTNNLADQFGEKPVSVKLPDNLEIAPGEDISTYRADAKLIDYTGKELEGTFEASPFKIEEKDGFYDVIFQFKYNSGSSTPKLVGTFFSWPTKVTIKEKTISSSSEQVSSISSLEEFSVVPSTQPSSSESSSTGCSGTISVGFITFIAGIAVAILKLSKKEQ